MPRQPRKRNGQFDRSASLARGKQAPTAAAATAGSDARLAAYPVTVLREEGLAMIAVPSGEVVWKMYDAWGAGVGAKPVGFVGRWIHRKAIRAAIAATHETTTPLS